MAKRVGTKVNFVARLNSETRDWFRTDGTDKTRSNLSRSRAIEIRLLKRLRVKFELSKVVANRKWIK